MPHQPKTRVRIKVLLNAEGKWAAYAHDSHVTDDDPDEVLDDMMGDADISTARAFWITADIPTPQPAEIEASEVQPG